MKTEWSGCTPHWTWFPTPSEGLVIDVTRGKARRPTELIVFYSFHSVCTPTVPCGLLAKGRWNESLFRESRAVLQGPREPGWHVLLALPSAGRQEESVERGLGPGSGRRLSGGRAGWDSH